ncbi:MAG: CheA signal transduction histidine kinase [Pedosphaera sp.]|nr:CheA signal transduction histidine kinase [Pedosphaera sp.]
MKLFGKWLFGKWRKDPPPADEPAFAGKEVAALSSQNQVATNIGKGRKILVVDDNMVVLKAFELKLKACGFEVLTASEGAAAVSIARQSRPDLIVLDINFPPEVGSSGLQWDGFNIMQWMRRFQEAAKIPVIIITSGEAAKFKDKSLAAGAVEFFQKPVNFDEFLLAANKALSAGGNPATTA